MLLGLIADLHDRLALLEDALRRFELAGVEQVVVLGDLIETAQNLEAIGRRLTAAGAIGVWGNHELGLCHEPEPELLARFPAEGVQFLATLRPQLSWGPYLFSHALPTVDHTDPTAYYDSPRPHDLKGREACFRQFPDRVVLTGHYHRWFAAVRNEVLPWQGERPLDLSPTPMIVVVHALMEGWCATLDDQQALLHPYRLGSESSS